MKRISTLLALTLAAGAAFADDLSAYPAAGQAAGAPVVALSAGGAAAVAVGDAAAYPTVTVQGTPRTRAEVNAEVERARAEGTLATNEAGLPVNAPTRSVPVFAHRAGRSAL